MNLDDWLAGVHPRIAGLEGSLDVDFSHRSLADLERLAGEGDDSESFVNAAAAYLGETLLRVGGGRWIELDGDFAVAADPTLGLPPVVPAELVGEPGLPTGTYDEWAAAVAARKATDPGWEPVVEPTPGFRPERVARSPQLDRWLAGREAAFPRWAARWAPEGTWDFSPSSLDRLAELLLRELGDDPDALGDPGNGELVDGAAWYVGEAYRRAGAGQWSWADRPVVVNLRNRDAELVPLVQLELAMLVPGYLGGNCASVAGPPQ